MNIAILNNESIGSLVKEQIGTQDMRVFNATDSVWVTAVYNYITSRNHWTDSYQELPILPLSNLQNTFVAMHFWKKTTLLPPVEDNRIQSMLKVFDSIYIRADLKLENARQKEIPLSTDRFLDYLHDVVNGNFNELDQMLRRKELTSDSHRQVLSFHLILN